MPSRFSLPDSTSETSSPPAGAARPLKIVLIQTGSRGDLQPFCLLGRALKAAGHSVALAAEVRYASLADTFGIDYRPLAGDSVAALADSEATKQIFGGSVATIFKVIKEWKHRSASPEDVLKSYAEAARGADVIVAGGISFCEGHREAAMARHDCAAMREGLR